MGLLIAKLKHTQYNDNQFETSVTRYVESLLELYETICTNFTKGNKKRTMRADQLHYIELIEELIYDCIEAIEDESGEYAVYLYKVQVAQINSTFRKNILAMRGDNRLKLEDCIRNHARVIGWFS